MFSPLFFAMRHVGLPAVLLCAIPVKLALSSGLVPASADAQPEEVNAPSAPPAEEPSDASPSQPQQP